MEKNLLKNAVITNNVCNGSTTIIQLFEEIDKNYKPTYRVITLQSSILFNTTTDNYSDAFNMFKIELRHAIVL